MYYRSPCTHIVPSRVKYLEKRVILSLRISSQWGLCYVGEKNEGAHSLRYVSLNRSLTAVGQIKATSHSLVFTRDSTWNREGRRAQVRPSLFNNWTIRGMDTTSGRPQVELSLLCSISLKIRHLHKRTKNSISESVELIRGGIDAMWRN